MVTYTDHIRNRVSCRKNVIIHHNSNCTDVDFDNWLEGFGFTKNEVRKHPRKLSGGYFQRLSWACATLEEKKLVILDEAFSDQDLNWTEKLSKKVREIKYCEKAVVLVTHDPDVLLMCSDRVFILSKDIENVSRIIKCFDVIRNDKSGDEIDKEVVRNNISQLTSGVLVKE